MFVRFRPTSIRLRGHSLPLSMTVAFVIASTNVTVASADAPTARSVVCPTTVALESSNGTDYIAVFSAPTNEAATFAVTLYGKADQYSATTPALPLAMPYGSETGADSYRSAAIDLQKPAGDEPVAASIVPTIAGSSTVCPADEVFIPSVASLTDPHRAVSPQQANLENAFGSEIGTGEHALTLAVSPTTLACAKPFARVGITTPSIPQYTIDATEQRASGVVDVLVDVNESGVASKAVLGTFSGNHDLDMAALDAAHATVYHPEIFACKARPAHYLFIANFTPGMDTQISAPMPTNIVH